MAQELSDDATGCNASVSILDLATAWQTLDDAMRNVTTALPDKLSERVAKADTERYEFNRVIQTLMLDAAKGKAVLFD